MKTLRLTVTAALSCLLVSQLIFDPNIKSVVAQQNSSCQEAIRSSEIRLMGDRPQDAIRPPEGTIILVDNRQNLNLNRRIIDISQNYRGYPPDKFLMVYFAMSGSRGADIMNSPRMMQEISRNIISNCSNFGAVHFGIWNTDDFRVYGMVDGQVTLFRCGDEITSSDERRDWGLQGCY